MGRFEEIPDCAPHASSRLSDFWLHDGVVHGRRKQVEGDTGLVDAIEAIDQLKTLTDGQSLPLCFDGRNIDWLHIDTRAYVRHHLGELFSRAAMIVEPHMLSHVTHALMGSAGSGIPFQIFTDEEEAWQFAVDAA